MRGKKISLQERQIGGVSFRLTAFVILVVTLLSIISNILTINTSYKQTLNTVHNNSWESLQSASNILESRLEKIETVTANAALLSEMITSDPESPYELLEYLRKSCPEITAACIMFREDYYPSKGRLYGPEIYLDSIGNWKRIDCAKVLNYVEDDVNWQMSSKGDGYWCHAFKSRLIKNSALICYSYPIYDADGGLIGIICAEVTLDWLKGIMEGLKPAPESIYLIVDNEDNIICCSYESYVMSASFSDACANFNDEDYMEMHRVFSANEFAMVEFDNPADMHTFAYCMPFSRCNWSLAFSYPYDYVKKPPLMLAKKLLLISTLTLLLLFALLFFGILKIVKPFTVKLNEATAAQAGIESELMMASSIQKRMVPVGLSATQEKAEVDIASFLQPARMVGGDLYDFFIHDGRLYFCIGDVSGKGMPAALLMSMVRSLFRNISRHYSDPAGIMSELNREILNGNDRCMFCTMFTGVLNLSDGRLDYCNAGHNPPVLLRRSPSGAQFMSVNVNCVIGAFDDSEYETGKALLRNNDVIFLYTDGVTEAENTERELFGEKGMLDALSSLNGDAVSSEMLVNGVYEKVRAHAAGAEQSDDITMLAIRYLGMSTGISFPADFQMTNNIQEVPAFNEWTANVCRSAGMAEAAIKDMQLAVEEAVVNVISYAYPGMTDQPVLLMADCKDGTLEFVLRDKGIPFNPLEYQASEKDPDGELRPGGFGIFFYKSYMSSVLYSRENGWNILTMNKVISDK